MSAKEACGRVWRNLLFKNLKPILSILSTFHHFFIHVRLCFHHCQLPRWWSWMDNSKVPYDDTHKCCFLWQLLNLRKFPASQPWLPRAPCWNSWQLFLSAMNNSSQQLSPAITASYSCSPRVPLLLTCSNNLQQHLDLSRAAHLSISLSAALLKDVLWQGSNGAILLIWRAGLVFKLRIPPTLASFYGTRQRGILLLTASSALVGSWSSISFSSEWFIMHTKSNFQVVSYS